MKILSIAIALSIAGLMNLPAQTVTGQANVPAPTAYTITTRDGNCQVWQRTTYETSPDGKVVPHIHQYTELATGLNHLVAGQWAPSDEIIAILPDGTAAATNGQHQAYFPSDIYNGEIKLVTPDGKILQSQPAGLSYDDGSNTVLIAVLTNSIGQLVSSNQIVYPNAFSGINADLRYTYTRAAFEQDVILHEQPPSVTSLGLNADTTRIQILTEFFNSQTPKQFKGRVNKQEGLVDTTLQFGQMRMVQGKAFVVGDNDSLRQRPSNYFPVYKNWVQTQGRNILIEELPYQQMTTSLQTLPVAGVTTVNHPEKSMIGRLSKTHLLPQPRTYAANVNHIQLARADSLLEKGVVLDYVTISLGQTNFTFQGDTTYYINGEYNLSGTTTIEGGTVIKFGNNDSFRINLQGGGVVCKTDTYRPVVITAKDDNSIGEAISGSTGTPAGIYGNGFELDYGDSPIVLHDIRFSHCQTALTYNLDDSQEGSLTLRNIQAVLCSDFLSCNEGVVFLENCLFSELDSVFIGGDIRCVAEQVTVDNCDYFGNPNDGGGSSLLVTNCLVTAVANVNGDLDYETYNTVTLGSSAGVYKTVGGGSYYLPTNSIYHNAGTPNINSILLADIATKTTYPPIAYTNVTFSTAQIFSPQAQRDNVCNPDLGYHYDPLDYTFGGCTANSNFTFTAGTAVGWFRTSSGWYHAGYGITLANQQVTAFLGTATSPDYWVRLNAVQENDRTAGYGPGGLDGQAASLAQSPQVQAKFLKSYIMNNDGNFWRDDYGYLIVQAQNCEFGLGGMGGYSISLYLTNCLFDHSQVGIASGSSGNVMSIMNSTFHGGLIYPQTSIAMPVSIINCALDSTTVSCSGYALNSSYATYNYNAYTNSSNPFPLGGANDVHVSGSFNWQSSWFGSYYQPTNSLLINMGSTTADQVGLYHFTTQTNQTIEANSQVEIGYHYVATDAYGNPLDSNGDGIPDYLEDANGNGIFDAGDLGEWKISPFGLSAGSALQVFTPLK